MKTRMADWSHWQGSLAPGALTDAGIDGAWLKACGASDNPFFVDDFFLANVSAIRGYKAKPLILGAFAYLTPGYLEAQAALFYSLLRKANGVGPQGFAIKVDVEQAGLTTDDIATWYSTWNKLCRNDLVSPNYPTLIYTQKSKWDGSLKLGPGAGYTPHLEEAHWVESAKRSGPIREQERGIYPDWWDVDYAGWQSPLGIQFTDTAPVGTLKTTCSLYWCRPENFTTMLVR